MDVAVTELRNRLAEDVDLARHGTDIVVLQHGMPVVRMSAIDASDAIERPIREGVIQRPADPVKVNAAARPRV
jgi:prevent-host-death family protein